MRSKRLPHRHDGERGAALVEFALVAPLLFAILFAIVEFGWAFYQVLDTRHGAREAARLIAVDYTTGGADGDDQRDVLVQEICGRIESPATSRVEMGFVASGAEGAGDLATVRVERDLEQVTGLFDNFLKGVTPASEVTFRLERDASWEPTVGEQPCP